MTFDKVSDHQMVPTWPVENIERIAEITTGAKNTQDRIEAGQYPFFVRSQKVERINTYSFDGEAVLTAGDGVGTGKVFHYVNGKFDCHQRVYQIRNFDRRVDGYFFYLYFSAHFAERVAQMTAKSSVDSVRREMIASMEVPVPPIAEQKAVASAVRDIDVLLERLDALLAKKRDLKKAAMQQLLTGQTRLAGFDAPWQTAGLGTLFEFSGGLSASREQLSSSGHCYLHYGDIHLSTKPYVDVCAEGDQIPRLDVDLREVGQASLLKDGDVVFVDASEDDEGASKHIVVENAENLPYISGLHTIVAKSRGDHLDKLFKRYCFQSRRVKDQFKFYAVGTKVSGISKSNIAKIELTFPT